MKKVNVEKTKQVRGGFVGGLVGAIAGVAAGIFGAGVAAGFATGRWGQGGSSAS